MRTKSTRKNIFEYIVLSLFVMCIGFALSATLEYSTVARERLYMKQGVILLLTVVTVILLIIALRVMGRISLHINYKIENIVAAVLFVGIMVLGFYLRVRVMNRIVLEPESDFETYYKLGELLAQDELLGKEGKLYVDYVAKFPHTIGFPSILLSPVFKLFGISVRNALNANLVFSMLSIGLVYFIVRQKAGRFVSIIAMSLMAIWPSHVLYSSMVASEPLFTFFILLATLMFAMISRDDGHSLRKKHPVLTVSLFVPLGISLGMANAVRPMAVILLIAMAMVFVFTRKKKITANVGATMQILSRGWVCAIMMFAVYFLTSTIMTQNVFVMTNVEPAGGVGASGFNLLVGTNYEHKGTWNEDDAELFNSVFDETASAEAAHEACMEKALERIKDNPENTIDLFIYKFRDLWQTDDFGVDWNLLWTEQQGTLTDELKEDLNAIRPISRQLYFMLLVFIIIAAIQQWWRNKKIDPVFYACMLFFLGTAFLHMLLETQVRYHYNMIPFFIIMASFAMAHWQKRTEEEQALPEDTLVLDVESAVKGSAGGPVGESSTAANVDFDMSSAIKDGHILISVSENSALRSGEDKQLSSYSFWNESKDKIEEFNNPEASQPSEKNPEESEPEPTSDVLDEAESSDNTKNTSSYEADEDYYDDEDDDDFFDDDDDDGYIPKRG